MLKGLITPILTPFNDDLTIADDLLLAHAEWLLGDGGSAGLALFGTTGEALSVGIKERMASLDMLIAKGIDPKRIIVGTGLNNLADTTELTRHATAHGCLGVMMLPPFYFKNVSDDGLYRYYAEVIKLVGHADLKIYLYHIPQVAGVGLSLDLVARLTADFAEVVGIKDSSGDWQNTEKLLAIDGLIVYPGAETPVIDAIKLGAPGCISATGNINSPGIAEVIRLCHGGDYEGAEENHIRTRAIRALFQDYAPIPAQKALLARWQDARYNNLRPPLMAMDADKATALERALIDDFNWNPQRF